jgi:uncharacterized SAM-binding protein YcdF (DUF218 family)
VNILLGRPARPAPPPEHRPARGPRWLVRFAVGGVLVVAAVIGLTAVQVWRLARVDYSRPVDAVVVLGAAQYDGSPSPIFAARLKHAMALYHDGYASRIVTVGGRRAGDGYTEASAGRRYLADRGVPTSALVAVGEGSDTLESLRAVAKEAQDRGWHSALLVSDPWHLLRARTMARDAGLEAWTSPTRSGPIVQRRETQIRYIVRETGALLFYRLTHASVDETDSSGLG